MKRTNDHVSTTFSWTRYAFLTRRQSPIHMSSPAAPCTMRASSSPLPFSVSIYRKTRTPIFWLVLCPIYLYWTGRPAYHCHETYSSTSLTFYIKICCMGYLFPTSFPSRALPPRKFAPFPEIRFRLLLAYLWQSTSLSPPAFPALRFLRSRRPVLTVLRSCLCVSQYQRQPDCGLPAERPLVS